MPRRRHRVDPADRLRAHRHRPGVRVRLLRHPGVPRAPRGGLPRHPRQLEPGDDHDRPGVRRRHLRRAARPRHPHGDHRPGAARRRAADPRRADGAQPRHGARRAQRGRRRPGHARSSSAPTPRRSPPPRTASGSSRRCRASASPSPSRARPTTWTRPASVVARVGLPVVIRPAFILGGKGTGIAVTPEEFERAAANGLAASPISEILIEQSIAGWKEYELEVMRDRADNCVVICSIENLDPMGVHTGDSITVAPAQTLTDVEYQRMRDAAFACIRRVGVETGGSNVQFALDPANGEMVIIEMNPRVSRSLARWRRRRPGSRSPRSPPSSPSATRSTRSRTTSRSKTPASFEPVIDYVVTKVPRWAFEKFPGSRRACSARRCSPSARRWRSAGRSPSRCRRRCAPSSTAGSGSTATRPRPPSTPCPTTSSCAGRRSAHPTDRSSSRRRCAGASRSSASPSATKVDPWFLDQILQIVDERLHLAEVGFAGMTRRSWRRAKRLGFGDAQLALPLGRARARGPRGPHRRRRRGDVQDRRHVRRRSSRPRRRTTTRPTRTRTRWSPSDREKVVILGSGPNRIGQGIEFDYCCVHAAFALGDAGLRDGHGQLQPRDGVDRLRHVRPALLRADHPRGRAQRARRRAAVRRPAGRDRLPRRPDAAQAGRRPAAGHGARARRRRRSTWPRTGSAGTTCAPASRSRSPPAARRRRSTTRSRSSAGSATRRCCGPRTCSAVGP